MKRLHVLLIAALLLAGGCTSGASSAGKPLEKLDLGSSRVGESEREKAMSIIELAADSPTPVDRANAAQAAQELPTERAEVVLAKLLMDPDARVRFSAAMSGGKMKLAEFEALYRSMSTGESPNGRVAGTYALHEIGQQEGLEAFRELAKHESPLVRANTVLVLGLIGGEEAAEILRPMRADDDQEVRSAVAEALWRLGDEVGFRQLLGFAMHSDERLRWFATSALPLHKDPRVHDLVVGRLSDTNPYVRLVAAGSLAKLEDNRGYPLLIEAADASPDTVQLSGKPSLIEREIVAEQSRALSAAALGDLGQGKAGEVLGKLLDDNSPVVRINAAAAVLRLPVRDAGDEAFPASGGSR